MNLKKIKKFWERVDFRTRLTCGLTGLFVVILSFGYWALYLEFQNELQTGFDHALYNYAADLLKDVELDSGGQADLSYNVIFSADKIFPFPHGDALVKIYQKNQFHELFSFSSDKYAPKNLSIVREHLDKNKDDQFFDLQNESGVVWRGVLMQVDDAAVPEIYFFVAVPRNSLTAQENKFRSIFAAGQIVMLLLMAFMTSIIAKGLLKSLEELTQSIHAMPINSASFQFSVPPGPPEITVLAKLLNQLLTRLNQSLLAHQEFVAQAAHQLKTPLTIAKGHLEQLQQSGPIDPDNNLKIALGEIDIMSGTISNLLNLVQVESGFQSFKTIEINLLDQVLLDIDRLDYLARKKALKFQIQCDDRDLSNKGWMLTTDPQLLSIIFNNLLENAIKYAYESPIEVNISVEDNYFVIQITNKTFIKDFDKKNGRHLYLSLPLPSSTDLKEKFVRGHTPETGQGLGLYIVYKIVTILKGQLEIEETNELFHVRLKIPNYHSPT